MEFGLLEVVAVRRELKEGVGVGGGVWLRRRFEEVVALRIHRRLCI